MAELSERDVGILQNEIDLMEDEIQVLQDGIESDYRKINNLLLKDIATKKFVDEKSGVYHCSDIKQLQQQTSELPRTSSPVCIDSNYHR